MRERVPQGDKGKVIGKGGPLNGKNLNDYIGFNSEGFISRENSKGRFIEHNEVREIVKQQIDNLVELDEELKNIIISSWGFSLIAANTPLSSTIPIGKVNIPVTVALSILISIERKSLSADQKKLLNALLDYYQSGNTKGLYEIKMHTGNMFNPFSEKMTYNLYYSNGKHLTTISNNALLGF